MLLAALLLFLLAGPSAAQTAAAVSCDSEAELLGSLTWVRDACSQAGEQFDDDDTLVPGAVTTRGCAEVVRRAWRATAVGCSRAAHGSHREELHWTLQTPRPRR